MISDISCLYIENVDHDFESLSRLDIPVFFCCEVLLPCAPRLDAQHGNITSNPSTHSPNVSSVISETLSSVF